MSWTRAGWVFFGGALTCAVCSGLGSLGCAPAADAPSPNSPPAASASAAASVPPPSPPSKVEPEIAPLRLVDGIWAPFTDVEGKPRIALALVHEALRRAGVRVETTFVGPGALLPTVKEQGHDGSEALWKSPDREEWLYYSEPYLQNRLVLLARRGTDVSATQIAQLKGKKLGVVREYAYGPEILEAKNVKLISGDSDEANLKALLEGKLDYIVVDDLLVHQLFDAEPKKSQALLAVGQHPIVLRGLHLALRKDYPNAQSLLKRFDEQMATLRRDGTYNRMLNVHWLLTDADGDGADELILAGNQAGQAAPSGRYQLFGAPTNSAPRILIEGQIYEDWANVPDRFKVPQDKLDTFVPAMQAVLVQF